uniref:Uncharacterized protein n=1 Tax=Anopheles minimus TaxID=112268 RepID=A0A182WNH0_9DIPT
MLDKVSPGKTENHGKGNRPLAGSPK